MGSSSSQGELVRSFGSSEVRDTMGSMGTVIGVCLSKRRRDPKKNVQRGYIKKGVGLVGDSHAGTEKEVSLLTMESVQAISQRTGIEAPPGSFAENITIEGLELKTLPIGTEIQVGGARLNVIGVGKDPSAPHTYSYHGYSLLREEGIFCKVTKSGHVKVGDVVKIVRERDGENDSLPGMSGAQPFS
jgi:MOSC domain-containing protein YiiM